MSRDPVYGQLESTIATWTDEVTQAHSQLTNQIAEARDQLDTLSTIMAKRQGESSALAKSREDITRLKESVRQRDTALRQVQHEHETLERKNSLSEQLRLQAEERVAALRKEKEQLDQTLADSRTDTREALGRISTLELDLAAHKENIQELQRDAEGDRIRIEALNGRVSELQMELVALTKRALAGEHEAGSLASRLATAEHDRQSALDDLAQKQEELRNIGELLAEREIRLEAAQQRILENQSDIGKLQIDVGQLNEIRGASQEELALLRTEKSEMEDRVMRLSQDVDDVRRENEQLILTLAGLREALADSARILDETTTALLDLQHAHASLQEDLEQCQWELEEAGRCAQQQQEDYSQLQDAHNQVQTALASYHETLEALKLERLELKNELEARALIVDDTRQTVAALRRDIQCNEVQIQELTSSLEIKKQSLADEHAGHAATSVSLAEARTALDAAEARIDAMTAAESAATELHKATADQLAELAESERGLRQRLYETDAHLNKTEQELVARRDQLWNLTAEQVALAERVVELESLLTQQATTLETTTEELSRTLSTLGALTAENEQLKREAISAEHSIVQLRDELVVSEERALSLTSARNALAEEREHLLVTVSALEQTLGTERDSHATDLATAREEQQALLHAIDVEQSACAQLQAIIAEHEAAAMDAARRINQAEDAIAGLTTQASEIQAHFSEELRQARERHEIVESQLHEKEGELAQRTGALKQREVDMEQATRALARLEENLSAQKDQFESMRTALECDVDAANNRVRSTEASLQGSRAENTALTNVLKEKEEWIGREQRSRQQLETAHRAVTQDLETYRKRVSITEAENESLETQLENATLREQNTARELSRAMATIQVLQETIQQKENAVQHEKIRTAQLLHQTVSALQTELTQINSADAARTPSSKWMTALNLDGPANLDEKQRELPFSGDENGSGNGSSARNGAGHSAK